MDVDDIRFKIAAARRILANNGCESRVAGHVSARAEGEDAFYVTPFEYFDETAARPYRQGRAWTSRCSRATGSRRPRSGSTPASTRRGPT